MKLGRQIDYALKAMITLTKNNKTFQIKDISNSRGIPHPFLIKIIQMLNKAGLVRTLRGPKGGVFLSRDPSEITLKEIIEAVSGKIKFNPCSVSRGNKDCIFEEDCKTNIMFDNLEKNILQSFDKVRLDSLSCENSLSCNNKVS
ncbi:MAG: Rrf2 family transcriptional regulator [Armatimonadetes bacterium]|nr:Rrf2 family transcriptional regulator [Armatimonadota bacterium]